MVPSFWPVSAHDEPPQRRTPSRRGQGMVEFAIVLPLLVLIVFGAIDFGRVLFSWIEVMNASREGAAYAVINPTDGSGIILRAVQETSVQGQRGEGGLDVTVTCRRSDTQAVVPCNGLYVNGLGSTVTVSITEPFSFFTPLFNIMFPSFHLSGSTTGFAMSPVAGGVAAPTPTPTPSPSPTASPGGSPTAAPTPTPTPNANLCVVPEFVGQHAGGATQLWTSKGFSSTNITNNVSGNSKVRQQSLGSDTNQPCQTATIILN
jgi:TadE-like protein